MRCRARGGRIAADVPLRASSRRRRRRRQAVVAGAHVRSSATPGGGYVRDDGTRLPRAAVEAAARVRPQRRERDPLKSRDPEPGRLDARRSAAAAAAAQRGPNPARAASRSSTRVMNDAGPMESMEVE